VSVAGLQAPRVEKYWREVQGDRLVQALAPGHAVWLARHWEQEPWPNEGLNWL
jgi:hypothetical protein